MRPRRAGPRRPIRSWFTTTSSTRAATSRRGSSRSCFHKRCARVSRQCGHKETPMRRKACVLIAGAALSGMVALIAPSSGRADKEAAPPVYVKKLPAGYRDWKLVSVAQEKGELNDIRAILGNEKATKAFREGKL